MVALIALAGVRTPAAAEPRSVSYDLAAAVTRYTKEYRVEVGDALRHELRLYDLKREFGATAPVFDGLRATESRERGTADLLDQNGRESGYVVYVLEDGNRVFGRYEGTVRTRRWPDGSRHYDIHGTIELTGGTGRFGSIRGRLRVWQALDPGADSNQGAVEGEYWFER